MKHIYIIFALIFFTVLGCLESSQYKEVSPSELMTNMTEYNGKKVCIDGIYENHSISGIKIGQIQNSKGDYGDGTLVEVCGTYKNRQLEADFLNSTLSLFTERDTYRLNETLRVYIDYVSPNETKGKVQVSGLKNPFDRLYINETREVVIGKGNNRFDFEFNIPSCEECSYLSPGTYMVNGTVNIGGTTFGTYKKIKLERAK